MQSLKSFKKILRPTYVKLYEFLTLKLLAFTSSMVRKLIVLKGKNPDYIPLPSSPQPEVKVLERPQFHLPYVPSWVATSFYDKTKHPLYKGYRPNVESIKLDDVG